MAGPSFESLFNPSVLKSLAHFEWTIRAIAKGTFLGNRISKRLGAGMEFSQYRPYTQGDDIRRLDWKMYGRSERFYIKQSEVETDVGVWFVLDDSLSMTYQEDGLTKFDYSRIFIGYLAYLSLLIGDSFGLITSQGTLPIGHGHKQWQRFVSRLYACKPSSHLDLFTPKLVGKEVILVLSDLYDNGENWSSELPKLKTRQNEVLVFHVLGSREEKLSFEGALTFQDLESGEKVQLTPQRVANSYQRKLSHWCESLRTGFSAKGIDYRRAMMMADPTPLIHQFLYESSRMR